MGLQSFPEFTSHVPMTSSPGVLPLSRRGEHNRKYSVMVKENLFSHELGLRLVYGRDALAPPRSQELCGRAVLCGKLTGV